MSVEAAPTESSSSKSYEDSVKEISEGSWWSGGYKSFFSAYEIHRSYGNNPEWCFSTAEGLIKFNVSPKTSLLITLLLTAPDCEREIVLYNFLSAVISDVNVDTIIIYKINSVNKSVLCGERSPLSSLGFYVEENDLIWKRNSTRNHVNKANETLYLAKL